MALELELRSMVRWRCTNCGTVHRSNPQRCKQCGHTVFQQDHSEPSTADRTWARVAIALIGIAILGLAVYVLVL